MTASILVDLSTEPDLFSNRDRNKLCELKPVPDGAHVIVLVGSREWVPVDAALHLHEQAQRLHIEIQGTPRANLRAWIRAARHGSHSQVGVVA